MPQNKNGHPFKALHYAHMQLVSNTNQICILIQDNTVTFKRIGNIVEFLCTYEVPLQP